MSDAGLHVAQRRSIRALESEARSLAASVDFHSLDHEFYFGVMKAARDYLHAENRGIHDERWLERQIPAFKDGYLKTCTLIGTTGGNPPLHLPLPSPS